MSRIRLATTLGAVVALVSISLPTSVSAVPAPPDAPRASSVGNVKSSVVQSPSKVKPVVVKETTAKWLKCSTIVNTVAGSFTCVKVKKITVRMRFGSATKPAYVKEVSGKWVPVPYSWNGKKHALVFNPGLVPLSNAARNVKGMSSAYQLVMRECRTLVNSACKDFRETVVWARVKTTGKVYDKKGKSSLNATWSPATGKAVSNTVLLPLPSSPLDLKASVNNKGVVHLSWSPPTTGAPFTGYNVTSSPVGVTVVVTGTGADVSGVVMGKEYTFSVSASNKDGVGSPATVTLTPQSAPLNKSVITAIYPGNKSLDVSWQKISDSGGLPVTDYALLFSGDEGVSWAVLDDGVSDATSTTIKNLVNGKLYYIAVAPINALGTGEFSAPAAGSPYTASAAPRNLSATPGNYSMTLRWDAPTDDGGRAVSGYRAYYSVDDGATWVKYTGVGADGLAGSTDTNVTVVGLANGSSYLFAVSAYNLAGESGMSESVTATPYTIPDAPANLQAVAGDTVIDVAWDAPAWDGGSPITSYTVRTIATATLESAVMESVPDITGITDKSVQVTGLVNGTEYAITVFAVNDAGESVASTPLNVTPYTVPDAPTNIAITEDNGALDVSWVPPVFDGGRPVTSNVVTISPDTASISYTSDSTARITGLENGTEYTLSVAAVNARGTGPDSGTAFATPRTVPDAPTDLATTPDNGQVMLTWNDPAWNGGSDITGYTITVDDAAVTETNVSVDVANNTATISGLTNGSAYSFSVQAVNEAGSSVSSPVVVDTPRTVADTPTGLVAAEDNTVVDLMWDAPVWDGGSAITGYTVTVSPDDGNVNIAGTTAEITGLTNGTEYTFTVTADNVAGHGVGTNVTATPRTVPDAPTNLVTTPDDTVIDLVWNAPVWNGGSPVTEYIVSVTPEEGTLVFTGETSAHISGLANGVEYTFAVTAVNEAGNGAVSDSAAATPRTVPDAPAGLDANPGNASADLTWDAPVWDGGNAVTGYAVSVNIAGTGQAVAAAAYDVSYNGTTATVTGLANGTEYLFTVQALNEAGAGAWADPTQTIPYTVPDPVTSLTASADNTLVNLTWDAPVWNGGNALSGYHVTVNPNVGSVTINGTSAQISGLANGTMYTFTVTAYNAAGDSSDTTATAKPRTIPDVPTNLIATPDNTAVDLTWDAPVWNGGANIDSYEVTVTPAVGSISYAGTSAHISGLANGTEYTFSVQAINEAGISTSSNDVAATPRTVPDAPTNLIATPDATKVHLTWDAPAWDGGNPITGYIVYISPAGGTVVYNGTSADVTGLDANTEYTFTVVAVNAAGGGSQQPEGTPALTPPAMPPAGLDLQTCTQTGCDLTFGAAPGATSYLVYRNGELIQTLPGDATSFSDTPLTPETAYTYVIIPVNKDGVHGSPLELALYTLPSQPTLLSGPAYTASTNTVSMVVDVPNAGADVIYHATAKAGSDVPGVITCTATECTAEWTGWAANLGTKYDFVITPSNPSGDGPYITAATDAPSTADLLVTTHTSYNYCPGGYPVDLGNGNCRVTAPYAYTPNTRYAAYTYHTESGSNWVDTSYNRNDSYGASWVGHDTAGDYGTCPQGGTRTGNTCYWSYPAVPNGTAACPGGWSIDGNGQCHTTTYWYECPWGGSLSGSTCVLYTWVSQGYWNNWSNQVKDGTPSGWYDTGSQWAQDYQTLDPAPNGYSDSGSYWYQDTAKIVYNSYKGVTTYEWNDTNLIAHNVGSMYVNGVLTSGGTSGELDRCVGTVTFELRGIGGTSTATATGACN